MATRWRVLNRRRARRLRSKAQTCGFDHKFEEEYYGWRCAKCDLFYPYGCAPWDDCGDRGYLGYDYDDGRLHRAIEERREYASLNYDFDDEDDVFTDEDAIDELMGECGQDRNGSCSMAWTEYCDWECPFSS